MEEPKAPFIEERMATAFERTVTTAERVGIPVATFAVGAWAIFLWDRTQIAVLPWLGVTLILASLATYAWLTSRSTISVQSPPSPIPVEVRDVMDWMMREMVAQNRWLRDQLDKTAADLGHAKGWDGEGVALGVNSNQTSHKQD